uniref:Secreted protein n=1 Tax=Pyxicephalus adspersus TaxID=30357 RepID=A0AAV2ZMA6_PYXAD|nr:TPA: hypothetical protein GDO54_004050 [Pyxicephalus adspersus]
MGLCQCRLPLYSGSCVSVAFVQLCSSPHLPPHAPSQQGGCRPRFTFYTGLLCVFHCCVCLITAPSHVTGARPPFLLIERSMGVNIVDCFAMIL